MPPSKEKHEKIPTLLITILTTEGTKSLKNTGIISKKIKGIAEKKFNSAEDTIQFTLTVFFKIV